MRWIGWWVGAFTLLLALDSTEAGAPKKRVLLLWQSPDGHPKNTHEYELGQKILKYELDKIPNIDAILVKADDPWKDGPDILEKADGVVLFASEGARWLNGDPKRLAAFQACANRKAGLSVLHWGMGSKDAKNIAPFVDLFGGCHGGPDRKYKVVETKLTPANSDSFTIALGLRPFSLRDEFYYDLKLARESKAVLTATIDGSPHTVAWAYPRKDGGRSFGFSGLHFHENWQSTDYRRLVTQGVLWTLQVPIPKDGISIK